MIISFKPMRRGDFVSNRKGFLIPFVILLVFTLWGCENAKVQSAKGGKHQDHKSYTYIVKRGDTPLEVLRALHIEGDKLKTALRAYRKVRGKNIFPNDTFKVLLNINSEPLQVELWRDPLVRYVIPLNGRPPYIDTIPYRKMLSAYIVPIFDNLTVSFEKAGLPLKVLLDYANLFEWDIDFFTDTRNGDTAKVLIEVLTRGEKRVGFGRILYAEYFGKKTGQKDAFFFKGGYFDRRGGSLKKQFLKSPLPFGRVTSRFSLSRWHPILRIRRPHYGIDYKAPYGTPAYAVASGRVIFAGWNGGYGKLVRIKHKNGYITGYGHLSKIVTRRGRWVKQGQIIGYVGSTGLSTGPHLHFEIKKNGRYVNPESIKPPPTFTLNGKGKELFSKEKDRLLNLFNVLIEEKVALNKGKR